ncbi:hypothetical protein ACFQZC_07850 [Streptacidiphilus monticola]
MVRLDDELLDGVSGAPGDVELTGEAALLTALQAGRTGRMRDIVATLQAEQDRIIRSSRTGVLVVQGGPGTGKTVVALHRAAYLLYTHPRLVERGVLVVGPNPVFLSYIGQVLPGLGETSVLLATVGELFPGVVATATEEPAAAAVKGRHTMADVLAQAVRDRQAPVTGPVDLDVAGDRVRLPASFLEQAAERARGSLLLTTWRGRCSSRTWWPRPHVNSPPRAASWSGSWRRSSRGRWTSRRWTVPPRPTSRASSAPTPPSPRTRRQPR